MKKFTYTRNFLSGWSNKNPEERNWKRSRSKTATVTTAPPSHQIPIMHQKLWYPSLSSKVCRYGAQPSSKVRRYGAQVWTHVVGWDVIVPAVHQKWNVMVPYLELNSVTLWHLTNISLINFILMFATTAAIVVWSVLWLPRHSLQQESTWDETSARTKAHRQTYRSLYIIALSHS